MSSLGKSVGNGLRLGLLLNQVRPLILTTVFPLRHFGSSKRKSAQTLDWQITAVVR